jgi:hypothetical protein
MKAIRTTHYSGVQVSLCMMLIIQKNTMIIKKLMDTLQVPTPILRSMYGQVKLLSASALPSKGKFVVRLGRIKRFANIWESVTVDTVKHHETGSSFISFSVSSIDSANSFLSRRFSSSSAFSRRASDTSSCAFPN